MQSTRQHLQDSEALRGYCCMGPPAGAQRSGRCGNALFLHEDLLAQASASKTLEHFWRRRAAQSDADVGYGLLAVRRLQSGAMIEDPETHEEPLAMVGSWFISADSEQVLGMRFVEYCVMLRKRHDVTIRPLPLSTMRSGIECSRPCMRQRSVDMRRGGCRLLRWSAAGACASAATASTTIFPPAAPPHI